MRSRLACSDWSMSARCIIWMNSLLCAIYRYRYHRSARINLEDYQSKSIICVLKSIWSMSARCIGASAETPGISSKRKHHMCAQEYHALTGVWVQAVSTRWIPCVLLINARMNLEDSVQVQRLLVFHQSESVKYVLKSGMPWLEYECWLYRLDGFPVCYWSVSI